MEDIATVDSAQARPDASVAFNGEPTRSSLACRQRLEGNPLTLVKGVRTLFPN
ncbi:hypothetical protein ACTGJ9_039520 [Bradyrhizobium sp. RDM12]